MKRSKFTEEQIAFALKQAEVGTSVEKICRNLDDQCRVSKKSLLKISLASALGQQIIRHRNPGQQQTLKERRRHKKP